VLVSRDSLSISLTRVKSMKLLGLVELNLNFKHKFANE
jgi:hypothetical protein